MPARILQPADAADLMRSGEVIAYPTEAVFGLGCDPENEDAVQRLLGLKDRPVSAGLILIGSHFRQFAGWVGHVPGPMLDRALKAWPGAVTWLFPRGPKAPDWISGSHDSLAIRVTAHETCIELCDAFGGPVVSTSANPRSGAPARSVAEVDTYFGAAIVGIVAGALGQGERPSRIQDVLTGQVIREG